MAVDRMVPFRFVLIQLIFLVSVLTYSAISYLKQGQTVSFNNILKCQADEFIKVISCIVFSVEYEST